MSQKSVLNKQVKDYITGIKNKDNTHMQHCVKNMLQHANNLNQQHGDNYGSKALVDQMGKHVDLIGFMDSLNDDQLRMIRNHISKQVSESHEMEGGAVGLYTVLEIVLGVVFFPWSLLYFLFLR